MTAIEATPKLSQDHGKRVEAAISTNVRVYLGLSGKSQKALGDALGITKGAMSHKMLGKVAWSVTDLITAADFLGVSPAALMDDSILAKAEAGYQSSANVGALVGAGSPRYFASPYNPDGTLDTDKLGAVLGASTTQAGQNGPADVEESEDMTTVIMRTSEGDITINLFDDEAPKTVENFRSLATGEKEWTNPLTGETSHDPFYDGLTFHRIIKDFMIQGGCPLGTGTGGPGYDFDDEIDPALTFDRPYLFAMANAGVRRGADGKIHGTNGSQFFITTVPTPWLNGHHTIFGEVADDESKAVVDKLEAVPTDRSDAPLEPAIIISVEVQ